jgi:hypothetical protein
MLTVNIKEDILCPQNGRLSGPYDMRTACFITAAFYDFLNFAANCLWLQIAVNLIAYFILGLKRIGYNYRQYLWPFGAASIRSAVAISMQIYGYNGISRICAARAFTREFTSTFGAVQALGIILYIGITIQMCCTMTNGFVPAAEQTLFSSWGWLASVGVHFTDRIRIPVAFAYVGIVFLLGTLVVMYDIQKKDDYLDSSEQWTACVFANYLENANYTSICGEYPDERPSVGNMVWQSFVQGGSGVILLPVFIYPAIFLPNIGSNKVAHDPTGSKGPGGGEFVDDASRSAKRSRRGSLQAVTPVNEPVQDTSNHAAVLDAESALIGSHEEKHNEKDSERRGGEMLTVSGDIAL